MVQRVDPDYNPSSDEIESIARFITHAAHHLPPQVLYKTGGNGNGFFTKWVLGIVAGLIILGIPAIIMMDIALSNRMTAIETTVAIYLKLHP